MLSMARCKKHGICKHESSVVCSECAAENRCTQPTTTNIRSPKLADTLSGALGLCHDGNFDLGYQLINEVIGQLRAGA
jgi:hypothetical protein